MNMKRMAILLWVLIGGLGWSGVAPAQDAGVKKVNVADIMNKCCYQQMVEITGTMSQYELNATDNTYFYYVRDDFGSPIKITAGGKPSINPGVRVKVIGYVALSPTDGFYLTQQSVEKVGNKMVIYLIVGSAVVLVILVFVIIYFLVSSSAAQKQQEAQRAAAEQAHAAEIQGLRDAQERQRQDADAARMRDADSRARDAAAQVKQRTMFADGPSAPPSAVAVSRYQSGALKIVRGPEAGATLDVQIPFTTIGRGADNNIVLEDGKVSTQHARIEVDSGTYFLVDVGSTNGTFVNGNKVTARVPLKDGDRILLGQGVELAFIGKV